MVIFIKKTIICCFLSIPCILCGQEFTSSHLPIIVLNTEGAIIRDEPKTIVQMGIIHNENGINQISDDFNQYDGKIAIEFRGNSTQLFDKKSYALELRNADETDRDAVLLGMPEEEDWILYASAIDKTFIRNVLTYELWRKMGYWAANTRYCELMIDGDYQGIYVLMEKIKRDKNRLAISKLTEAETEGDDLTGGYIIRIDWPEGEGWWSKFDSKDGQLFFQYYYPRADRIQNAQKLYIRQYINAFEEALFGGNFTNLNGQRYNDLIDLNTFADLFIINELSRSVDAYKLSSFIHKDKDSEGGLLKAGPIWDFNLAYGNTVYCGATKTSGWTYLQKDNGCDDLFQMPLWWERFQEDCVFKNTVNQRWEQYRSNFLDAEFLFGFINEQVHLLGPAVDRNFNRWDYLGENLWDEPEPVKTTYLEEVNLLKDWLKNRIAWLDGQFIGSCEEEISAAPPNFGSELIIYPNPSNTAVTISFEGKTNMNFQMTDSVGKIIKTVKNIEDQLVIEDFGNLAAGVYFFELYKADFQWVERVIKVD